MKRMHEHLSPDVFYGQIRLFLAGWRNNELLPNGVVYEGVSEDPK
jgi:indoleamine 2,3-dioxygenase